MCQLQAPAQLVLFSLTLCTRPSSIQASSASPTPKVDELPEGGIKGIECWGILSTSQYMVNTFGYVSESTYMVASTGKNKTRLRLDQLGLSLLRGLHVCFVSFEGLTHAKQRKVADWKHQTPIQPKHEATSRRLQLFSAANMHFSASQFFLPQTRVFFTSCIFPHRGWFFSPQAFSCFQEKCVCLSKSDR